MSRPTRAGLLAVLLSFALASNPAAARDVTAGDLTIQHPWARATPNGAQVAGGYLAITNHGMAPDVLTGGSFEASAKFELHEMTTENGIMKMRPTGPLTIPPGGSLTLDPSGKHIMLAGLKHGLKKGDKIEGTLTFEHAGTVSVQFDVEGIGAKAPAAAGGHSGHSMPGMDMD